VKNADLASWAEKKLTQNQLELKRFSIGDYTYGKPTVLYPEAAKLTIGSYTSISDGVKIFLADGHHSSRRVSTYPFSAIFKGRGSNPTLGNGNVHVGSDVWLCSECTILPGVTVGDGAVVAACSVVSRDVASFSVVAGNPAAHRKWRFGKAEREALLRIQWWNWPHEKVMRYASLLQSEDVNRFIEVAENE
jgi:chloramphenicol O-acetyltransferase type B